MQYELETTKLDHQRLRKYIIAGCEWTSLIILVKLSKDKSAKVRRRVAENPKTPMITLSRLACDQHTDVRIGVCDNPATPPGLLLRLAGDICSDVRYVVAENSHTPRQILCLLARDENPYVADRALNALNRWQPILPIEQSPAA